MSENEATWQARKVEKLAKRIASQRAFSSALEKGSGLKQLSDRILVDLEIRLFRMRHIISAEVFAISCRIAGIYADPDESALFFPVSMQHSEG